MAENTLSFADKATKYNSVLTHFRNITREVWSTRAHGAIRETHTYSWSDKQLTVARIMFVGRANCGIHCIIYYDGNEGGDRSQKYRTASCVEFSKIGTNGDLDVMAKLADVLVNVVIYKHGDPIPAAVIGLATLYANSK